jgi:hypothetical protein
VLLDAEVWCCRVREVRKVRAYLLFVVVRDRARYLHGEEGTVSGELTVRSSAAWEVMTRAPGYPRRLIEGERCDR